MHRSLMMMMSIFSHKEDRLTARHFQLDYTDHNTQTRRLHTLETCCVVIVGSKIEDQSVYYKHEA